MSQIIQWVAADVDEKRSIAYSNLEMRAENDGKTLVGYHDLPMFLIESLHQHCKRATRGTWNDRV